MAFGLSPFTTPPKTIDPSIDLSPPSLIRQRAIGVDLTPRLSASEADGLKDSLFARTKIFESVNQRLGAGETDLEYRLQSISRSMILACKSDDPMKRNLLPTIARGVCISMEGLYGSVDSFSDNMINLKNEMHDAFIKIDYEGDDELEVLRLTMLGFAERISNTCECD